MAEHTKGPWHVVEDRLTEGFTSIESSKKGIAGLYVSLKAAGEVQANARLISAAPELLAAQYSATGEQYDDGKPITLADNLRELASMIEAGHDLQAEPNWILWLKAQADACDAAVAKATGAQNPTT